MKPIRTLLFAPGNRPDRAVKALGLNADAVIFDLEDAVPIAEKEKTRDTVREVLDSNPGKRMYVRVNALSTPYAREDVASLDSPNLAGIMLPKIETPEDLSTFNFLISDLEQKTGREQGSLEIISICETAKGLELIYPIASTPLKPEREMIIAFGAADYTNDMGIELTKEGLELDYARTRLPIASVAAGLAGPLDTPWMVDLKDIDALIADAKKAKACGFQGKICIHPNQIEPCHEVFTPTDAEIEFAQKVIAAFDEAEKAGQAAIQLEGKFIDYPVVERAHRIVALAEAISANQ